MLTQIIFLVLFDMVKKHIWKHTETITLKLLQQDIAIHILGYSPNRQHKLMYVITNTNTIKYMIGE